MLHSQSLVHSGSQAQPGVQEVSVSQAHSLAHSGSQAQPGVQESSVSQAHSLVHSGSQAQSAVQVKSMSQAHPPQSARQLPSGQQLVPVPQSRLLSHPPQSAAQLAWFSPGAQTLSPQTELPASVGTLAASREPASVPLGLSSPQPNARARANAAQAQAIGARVLVVLSIGGRTLATVDIF